MTHVDGEPGDGEPAFSPAAIGPGLWRWSAPHPGWKPENAKPGGWAQEVGSAAIEGEGGGPLVLVDPLAPSEARAAEGFWAWLGQRRATRGGLVVLLGNCYHGRSTPEILARWPETPVWGDPAIRGRASVAITHEIVDGAALPGGVHARAVLGLDDGELAFLVPAARALILTDAATGIGGGQVRVAPRRWGKDPGSYDRLFRASVQQLLELSFDRLLLSHGPSVLDGGKAALAAALAAEAWGDGENH